jgi:hypothetical protein
MIDNMVGMQMRQKQRRVRYASRRPRNLSRTGPLFADDAALVLG